MTTYFTNNAGRLTEVAAISSTTGVNDANKIIALDSSGKISATMLPTTSLTGIALAVTTRDTSIISIAIASNATLQILKHDGTTTGVTL